MADASRRCVAALELTTLGRTLHTPLLALSRWAEEYIAEVLTAREAYDAHR